MTRFGTAFVAIEPDFSSFDRLVARKLTSSLAGAGEQSGGKFGDGFTKMFERRSQGIGAPLDKTVADFNTKLRTKIQAPKIPAPTLPDVDLSKTARLDLQIAGAEANAEQLRAKIAQLAASKPTIEVKAQTAKAVADLDRVEAKLATLSAKRAEIKVDVDRSVPGVFASIAAGAQNLLASLGGGGGSGLGGATARVSAGFISFGSIIGPLVGLVAALAVTIGVSLIASLVALASSLALAVAGVGALGAAIGGVLVPAVGLAVATGLRLGKVFEALKASDAASDQASQKALTGSQAQAAAAQQQESAARGLADANRQLGVATSNAYREMADAAEAASDAIRNVEGAQLSLDRARLSTERAKLELAQFRQELGMVGEEFQSVFDKFTDVSVDTSGLQGALAAASKSSGGALTAEEQLDLKDKILAVREARQREKEAVDGVSDAVTASTRAQQVDNQFKREGIAASQGYQAALRGVQSATLAVAQAQKQQGFDTAQAKAINLTSKLTDRERQLLEAIKAVRTELKGAFKGATDAVFGGMLTALGRVPNLVNPLRGSFTRLGEAWGKAIDSFSRDLMEPRTISDFRAFTNGAARLAGPITDGLSALLRIFLNIGRAALPFLVSGTKKVSDNLEDWADATEDTKALNGTMKTLMGHLKTWLSVGASISKVFLAFLPIAGVEGKGLAESIKSLADRTTVWLNKTKNREEVRQFFKDTGRFAKDFVQFMARLIEITTKFGAVTARVMSRVVRFFGGDDGAKGAADGLVAALTTLVGLKFAKGVIGGIKDLRDGLKFAHKQATLLHAELFTGDATEGAGGFIAKAKGALKTIGSGLASAASAVVEAGKKVARRLIAIFAAEGAVAGRAAGTAAAGTSGLGSGVVKTRITASGATTGRLLGKSIIGGILLAIPLLIWEFKDAINKIGDDFRKTLVGKIVFAPANLGESLAKAFPPSKAFEAGASLAGRIAAGIVSAKTAIANAVASAVRGAVNTVASFYGQIFARGRDLILRLRGGMLSIASTIGGAVRNAIASAIDAISSLAGRLTNVGKRLGRALLNGIKDILSDVGGIAGDLGKTLANAVIGLLNKAIPNKIPGPGPLPDINLPDNPIPKFRHGGPIPGVGSQDTYPAMLMPGEFVTRKLIVRQFGPTVFADINEGRLDPTRGYQPGERASIGTKAVGGNRFATGGLVATPEAPPRVVNNFPINVVGGGPPDPVDLAAKAYRAAEARAGGDPGQGI